MGQLKINGLPATYDNQLLTPKHDEMMKLLFNKKVQLKISNYVKQKSKADFFWNYKNINNIKLEKVGVNLEFPIKGHNGFIIGIIDAVMDFTYSFDYEYDNKRISGSTKEYIGIEIKPNINNVGEVMRQLKIYSGYLRPEIYSNRKANIILFTNDEKEREIFESQKIGYISLQEMGDLNEY